VVPVDPPEVLLPEPDPELLPVVATGVETGVELELGVLPEPVSEPEPLPTG
jgi:hypothetical protein